MSKFDWGNGHYWGFHTIIDAKAGDLKKINDADYIKTFTKELVDAIKMKAYGDPWVESFANHDPDRGGITMIQLIETSNISCHFVAKTGDFYLDIFSCVEYDVNTALDVVRRAFTPKELSYRLIGRKA